MKLEVTLEFNLTANNTKQAQMQLLAILVDIATSVSNSQFATDWDLKEVIEGV